MKVTGDELFDLGSGTLKSKANLLKTNCETLALKWNQRNYEEISHKDKVSRVVHLIVEAKRNKP